MLPKIPLLQSAITICVIRLRRQMSTSDVDQYFTSGHTGRAVPAFPIDLLSTVNDYWVYCIVVRPEDYQERSIRNNHYHVTAMELVLNDFRSPGVCVRVLYDAI